MTTTVGIGLAFVAMLCWGIGDFLIQRSVRKIGKAETLFVISAFGALVLTPFVYRDLGAFVLGDLHTLLVASGAAVILLLAAVLDFEALRVGKLSVVEPIWSLEIPVAGLLAFFVLSERLTMLQTGLIFVLIVGLVLVSIRGKITKAAFFEKGAFIALVAAIVMGSANFFIGWGARLLDPLMINFVVNIFMAVVTFGYIVFSGGVKQLVRDVAAQRRLLFSMSVTDNTAWVAFAAAMVYAPLTIAVALSQSYIIIAVLLGLFVNRERISARQKIGLVGALIAAIVLAATVG